MAPLWPLPLVLHQQRKRSKYASEQSYLVKSYYKRRYQLSKKLYPTEKLLTRPQINGARPCCAYG